MNQASRRRSASGLLVIACLIIPILLSRPLVAAAFVNRSSISVFRWMMGDDHAGVQAGVFLTHSQRWGRLSPRQAGRVRRFQPLIANPEPMAKVTPAELYKQLRIARQRKSFQQVAAIKQRLVGWQPQYPLDVPTAVEALPGWKLLGYDLARSMLGPLSEVAITLYWQRDVPPGSSLGATQIGKWDWVWAGRRVYQIGRVGNLAPNGGFEGQMDLRSGYTPGWARHGKNCAVPPSLVMSSEHPKRSSAALSLVNGSGSCLVYSRSVPLPVSGPYLMGAWILVKSKNDGKACIGNTWWGSIRTAFCTSGPQWAHRAKIVMPRPEDEQLSLYVAVQGNGNRALFDDILFFPLDLQNLAKFNRLITGYTLRPSSIVHRP